MCVCVCVCVEREREREKEQEGGGGRVECKLTNTSSMYGSTGFHFMCNAKTLRAYRDMQIPIYSTQMIRTADRSLMCIMIVY